MASGSILAALTGRYLPMLTRATSSLPLHEGVIFSKYYASRFVCKASRRAKSLAASDPPKFIKIDGTNILDKEMLIKLEKLSGLRFESLEEIESLGEDIALAKKIFEVDTEGVEPLYNIVEEIVNCSLREDTVEECSKEMALMNAKVTIEDFFVTPKANIPLENNKLLDEIKLK